MVQLLTIKNRRYYKQNFIDIAKNLELKRDLIHASQLLESLIHVFSDISIVSKK